jgi:hypothetical protein
MTFLTVHYGPCQPCSRPDTTNNRGGDARIGEQANAGGSQRDHNLTRFRHQRTRLSRNGCSPVLVFWFYRSGSGPMLRMMNGSQDAEHDQAGHDHTDHAHTHAGHDARTGGHLPSPHQHG